VWDDSIARTATHRVVHEIDDTTPGLGPQPLDPAAAAVWQELMLRTLRDRVWLTDRWHEPQPIHPAMPATAMHERRVELQALMSTAPADHRELVERLTAGAVGSAEVHEHLATAANAQQERRDWIAANWPHVVELEQLNALIAAQPALAHWPTATPPAVQAVLDAMASAASPPPVREDRTLAALDQEAAENDPVRQAQAKVSDLDQLAAGASTHAEQAAIDEALRAARLELRQARREQQVDEVFARYGAGAHAGAVERRRLTVGYDVLTEPPEWVVEHLRRLHDDGRLGTTRVADLVTRVVDGAVYLDRHGHLPDSWAEVGLRTATREVPVVEIGVPEL
jgi:hypothetical protein